MPRLTFPFEQDGLLVSAFVGLAAPALQSLHAQGASLPPSIHARGIIDSGSTLTTVTSRILTTLNAVPGATAITRTASGPVPVSFYDISFTIFNLTTPNVVLSRVDWRVTNFADDPDDIDILFGLDLLREVVLIVDGPVQLFSLDF